MSSACTCHTDEWCFYCHMYKPLEEKHEQLKVRIGQVVNDLESRRDNSKIIGNHSRALGYEIAIDLIREVLATDEQVQRQEDGS